MNTRTRSLAALVALMTVLAASFLWWQSVRTQGLLRDEVLAQAEQRSLHLADAMGGQVEALIASLDLELLDLRREWLRDTQAFDPVARAVIGSLPQGLITQLAISNAEGLVVYDNLGLPTPHSIGEREHFLAQRNGAGADQMLIGKPIFSRPAKEWAFVVNRPIVRDGRFDGTVNLLVSSAFVSRRLAALQLSGKDVVALLYRDGTFLARSRDNLNAMGSRVPTDRPYLTQPTETSGIFRTEGLLDGTPRTYGWQRLRETGLIMAIGLADESVLTPLAPAFARGQAVTFTLVLLLVLCGGLIVALLVRAERAQAAVAASEAFRRHLFDSSYVPTVVLDARTYRFIDCNPAAWRIYGRGSRDEVLGQMPIDVSAPTQYDGTPSEVKATEYIEKARAEGSLVFEWRHQRPDGSQWDAETHLMSFESDGRQLMQFTLHDITGRKRTEAALRESEARLKEAQHLARIGNWQLDLTDNTLTWSDEIYRILECDPATTVPSYKNFILTVHPDERDRVRAIYQASLASRDPYDVVHRLVMRDGRVKYTRECGFTQFDGDRPVHSVGTVQDITDVRTAEESLKRLNEELEQRVNERTREMSVLNRELEAFSYSVSHDLRTPLRSVDGYASLLEEKYGEALAPEGRSYVDRIRKSARRMGQLITDLLTLAHLNRTELRRQSVDLSKMARAVAAELTASDPGRDVQWQIDDGMRVFADPGLMRVVLQNLLGNAWKYTGQTPQARIGLTQLRRADGSPEFCVRDNGAGFDMVYATQLFEPFKRLHGHHEFEGTGVGLTTVYRVIERHGGRLRGEGVVGQGASFYFSVPEAAAVAAAQQGDNRS
jgi:PAS domain S-box-containing protein